MGVDKPRCDGLPTEVDTLCLLIRQREDIFIITDCHNTPGSNSHCLCSGLLRIHRNDVGIVQYQVN
jgi:hypothetical protein